ncbi:endonuclease/exonuclease/phosphatase family protein [Cereibacter sp. SYSU M97828]|nr:endonuclease/exonuclease/phosphatase family protein [Cereibacter flavus]
MTKPIREISVASWNIHKGVGSDRRRDLHRTAAVIAELKADVIALQEADRRFGDRKGLLDLTAMRRDLGLREVEVAGRGVSHGWHGNVVLVREGIEIEEVHQMALPGFEPRGALMSDIVIDGAPLRVIGAHFGLLPRSRTRQTAAVLEKLAGLTDRPTLLMGDLNEWRVETGPLAGFLSHFPPAPVVPSFPARYPMLPLDRVMLSRGEIAAIEAHGSPLARRASDHLPIKARLRLPVGVPG